MLPRPRFVSILLVLLLPACEQPEPRAVEVQPEPVASVSSVQASVAIPASSADLGVPPGYEGPIDPEWPPSSAADLDVEIKAARLIRRAIRRGERPPLESLLEGDAPGVYAEEGRIGAFDYIEVVLGSMTHPDEAMPLIVLFHGRGGRPTIPKGPFSTTRPLRLFIPRGPDPLEGGYNWLATWTNSGNYELLSRSLAGRVDQLMPAIEAFAKLRPTLGKPIVAGFSQGGILSFALAVRYPSQFSAAFPLAGWLPPGMLGAGKKPGVKYPYIHAFHGGADAVVPTARGRATVDELNAAGIRTEYTEFPGVGHIVTPEMNEQVRHAIRTFFGAERTAAAQTP